MPKTNKKFITNCNGEPVEFYEDCIITGELSLKALGLYFCMLYGVQSVDFEDTESREAFEELCGKNYLQFKLKQS